MNIRRFFICEFAYSDWKKLSAMLIFQSKVEFLSANSRFAVQNDRTYLPRITRETCMRNSQICELSRKMASMKVTRIEINFKIKLGHARLWLKLIWKLAPYHWLYPLLPNPTKIYLVNDPAWHPSRSVFRWRPEHFLFLETKDNMETSMEPVDKILFNRLS